MQINTMDELNKEISSFIDEILMLYHKQETPMSNQAFAIAEIQTLFRLLNEHEDYTTEAWKKSIRGELYILISNYKRKYMMNGEVETNERN